MIRVLCFSRIFLLENRAFWNARIELIFVFGMFNDEVLGCFQVFRLFKSILFLHKILLSVIPSCPIPLLSLKILWIDLLKPQIDFLTVIVLKLRGNSQLIILLILELLLYIFFSIVFFLSLFSFIPAFFFPVTKQVVCMVIRTWSVLYRCCLLVRWFKSIEIQRFWFLLLWNYRFLLSYICYSQLLKHVLDIVFWIECDVLLFLLLHFFILIALLYSFQMGLAYFV